MLPAGPNDDVDPRISPGRLSGLAALPGLTDLPACGEAVAALNAVNAPGIAPVRDVDPSPVPMSCARWGEELVPVHGSRLLDLASYHHAGVPHSVPSGWLRRSALNRLHRAAGALPNGFGIAVFDAWRPWLVQQHLYQQAYQIGGLGPGYVTAPSTDPAQPPPHCTGGAVDVTLTYHGAPFVLGTQFDDFTAASHLDSWEHQAGPVRQGRRVLHQVMTTAGFTPLACEWWHYEFGTGRWAAATGQAVLYPASRGPVADTHRSR